MVVGKYLTGQQVLLVRVMLNCLYCAAAEFADVRWECETSVRREINTNALRFHADDLERQLSCTQSAKCQLPELRW